MHAAYTYKQDSFWSSALSFSFPWSVNLGRRGFCAAPVSPRSKTPASSNRRPPTCSRGSTRSLRRYSSNSSVLHFKAQQEIIYAHRVFNEFHFNKTHSHVCKFLLSQLPAAKIVTCVRLDAMLCQTLVWVLIREESIKRKSLCLLGCLSFATSIQLGFFLVTLCEMQKHCFYAHSQRMWRQWSKLDCLLYQLQKSKEREERLEEVIQAYEKIHLEKSNVQRDLDKMVSSPFSASAWSCNLLVSF